VPEILPLTERSEAFAETVAELTKGADGLVAVLDVSTADPDDPWATWVEDPAERLMLRAGQEARAQRRDPLVAVIRRSVANTDASSWRMGAENAAFEAVRGVVGCVALERAGNGLVANTVVVDDSTSRHDLGLTVSYLLDSRYNGYTIGATVHLTLPGYPKETRMDGGRSPGRVLITGAGGTIGFATAVAFDSAGYDVVLSDLDPDRLRSRQEQLPGSTIQPLDVTDRQAVHDLVRGGRLGTALAGAVFVHGFQGSQSLEELDAAMIRSSMTVNGTSVWSGAEELLPLLAAGGNGALVVVSSQCGIRAESMTAAYCAPKFGVIGLQRGLAGRLAEYGVSFNTLCPGPVDTAFLRTYFERFAVAETNQTVDEIVAERAASMAVGRFARPEEMGEALRFLAQLDATGVLLAPTGGETLT
jgi:NAD(P)-dependent dehydrogenase (short-subunit alcohol dehydrogenase family)